VKNPAFVESFTLPEISNPVPRLELGDPILAGVASQSGDGRGEPVDVVGVLVYIFGTGCLLLGPLVYVLDVVLG
jgi:hypothetical protein